MGVGIGAKKVERSEAGVGKRFGMTAEMGSAAMVVGSTAGLAIVSFVMLLVA